MLTEEAIQIVQSPYSKGIQSKDSRLASRHIYSTLITNRSEVLRQQINKRQKVNDECYQPLSCIALEKALPHDCPCVPTDCFILRSKEKLPKIISNMDNLIIQYVSSIDGSIRFDKTTFENVKYMSGNKFTGTKAKYFIKNDYLFVTNREMLKAVSANVLAEDPIEAELFSSLCKECNNCNCKSYLEFDFHTDRHSFTSILKLTKQDLIYEFTQMKEDKKTDTTEDPRNQAMIHR